MLLSVVNLVLVGLLPSIIAQEYDLNKLPLIANQTCPASAWISDISGFHYSSAQNVPQHLDRTYISGYDMPYIYRLHDRLTFGQTIFIEGKITNLPDNLNNFCAGLCIMINLMSVAPTIHQVWNEGAVVLHLAIRHDEDVALIDTIKNGHWLQNERSRFKHPFVIGGKMNIRLHILNGKVDIAFNGKNALTWDLRLPINLVDHITVDGPIEAESIRIGGHYFRIPFKQRFPANRLYMNDRLILIARPTGEFNVNILNQKEDIVMFFDVNFDRNTVIRNSLIKGEWGKEETEGGFPFENGVEFTLEIINKEHGLVFIVNNNEFATFFHRVNDHVYEYVSIELTNGIVPYLLEVCTA